MNSNYLPTDYQTFIATSRYARWLEEEGRRETWAETVERYITNIVKPLLKTKKDVDEIRDSILSLEVMPSMRSLMTAGKAASRDNTCMYNCSYLPVDDPKSFDEAMFILLCGTGVGFSVESQFISKLPDVPQLFESDTCVVIKDSKEGWAKGLRQVLALLWAGEIPKWDVSKVRPAGSRLKVFGGRASGPAPLIDLFNFVIYTFKQSSGRKLNSLECHDIMCKIGQVVVVGGVRRSAMISLSDLNDSLVRHAKSGNWYEKEAHRALANNSVAYLNKPSSMEFMHEWSSLMKSGSGERGIFNREASKKQAVKNGRRDPNYEFGTNPCSEIILRPYQFCNLSEVVIRATDTVEDIARKVRIATVLGTIQSTYTHFPYLRKIWHTNTAEERLLGVSLTGIMDNPLMTTKNKGLADTLEYLKDVAVTTNAKYAKYLDIPVATAISCVKPSGTVSQLVDSSSGIHARHSNYYIRTVRGGNEDPLTRLMSDQGIPNEPDVMNPNATTVFSFPMKAPEGAVVTSDMTAIEQLEMWLMYQRHWSEHKPSVTCNVKADEWFDVLAFVYKNFDEMSGVSFLPYDEHTYQQAPYTEVDEVNPVFKIDKDGNLTDTIETHSYKSLLALMPSSIDWSKLSEYELEDTTSGMQTLACSGDVCEMVDIT